MIDRGGRVGVSVARHREGGSLTDTDWVAVEEPLEIRIDWHDGQQYVRDSVAVTMRTPGADFELALGFLHGEGIIRSRNDYVDVAYCVEDEGPQTFNIVTVRLSPELTFDMSRLSRHFYTTSSCGVCGKASLEALELSGVEHVPQGPRVADATIRSLPDRLLRGQSTFRDTGGVHAAGLFTADGELVDLKEDVGRHNALDKLIGARLMAGKSCGNHIVALSGRASFELMQKAAMASVPIVVAVGAPSSLAIEVAHEFDITLCGFAREEGFNVYAGEQRVLSAVQALSSNRPHESASAE